MTKNKKADSNSPNLAHPRYWGTWAGVLLLRLIALLPFQAKFIAGKAFGLLAYHFAKERRHITTVNIKLCFPELSALEKENLVRETFIQNGIGLFESAWSWWAKPSEFEGLYTIENLALLEAAQQKGGVLLVGAHFVHLDLCGALLCHATPVGAIYRKNNNPVMERVITGGRQRKLTHILDRTDMRTIVRHLKSGETIWYAPDQDFNHRQSVFAPFFGQTASTLIATSRLAKLGNAQVVGFAHYRDPETRRYRLVFLPIDPAFPTGSDEEDARLVNQMLENAIREEPTQYMWVHRRFKTRPPGEKSVY